MTDPITVAVLGSALRAAAWEMGEALRRSSHSPIIREMYDYSCAVFTADGETVAQDELIPAFLGTMAATLPHVIEFAAGDLDPGDAIITNDPYRGGTHTPDIQLFVPIIAGGLVIGWCGNIAHHSDLGGTNPGTEGFANRSIFEEGVRIPPLYLVRRGVMNDAVVALVLNNIRDPASTAGDLRAQIASARLGQRRLDAIVARYGADVVVAAMRELLDQGERRIRAAIGGRGDGFATAEGWLDDDGLGGNPVRIHVAVTVRGDRVEVDLDGTAPQMAGGMNMSHTAATSAIAYVVKAMFDPDAPQDGAVFRAIDMHLPEGTIANPHFPAAVSLRHLAVQRLADTLVRAFAAIYPDLAVAGSFVGFSSLAAACAHPRHGGEVVIQDDLGGGMGGHAGGDGLSAVDVYLGNVQLLPAEICELSYPVRIVATELVPDSAGAGTFRGGLGIRRIYEFLDDADAVIYSEQVTGDSPPRGIDGGRDGTRATLVIERADGSSATVGKVRTTLRAGDRLVVTTGGGGGCGDPRCRDRVVVARDVAEGKVTSSAARKIYGL